MHPPILIQTNHAYGKVFYEPKCDIGKEFLRLTGTKTLTKDHLCSIRKIGFTFEQVNHEVLT